MGPNIHNFLEKTKLVIFISSVVLCCLCVETLKRYHGELCCGLELNGLIPSLRSLAIAGEDRGKF